MLVPGTFLGDRYEIVDLIGSGGMADVYKARCHKLNRYVAIKVLKKEYSTDKSFVSKFRVEAQSAAGLMHPNIVNVYDVGEENGMYYFVMELVEGITLKHYIEKKIRLTVKEAVSIAIQVSMGIEAAHNNGIIHRDIKPQNIIISKEGKVKVADFGIAKAASSDTVTSHAMGSVHYTSPEQARGGYSDAKSDIYSIGVTLFEMVTGHVPFDGETTVAIAIKHIQEEMPSPKIYVPDIPISVEQIILKCTQKNPDRRYANTGQLIRDLKHALMNPDDNFVVISDPASSEGTKAISDADRSQIRKQTIMQGPVYDNILPSFDSNEQRHEAPHNDSQYVRDYYPEQHQNAQYQNQQYQNPQYQEEQYAGGQYSNERYSNDQYVDNQYADNQYADEQYADNQYGYGEVTYVDNGVKSSGSYADSMNVGYQDNGNNQGFTDDYGNYEGYDPYEQPRPKKKRKKRKEETQKKPKKSGKSNRNGYTQGRNPKSSGYNKSNYYPDDTDDDVDPKMENVLTILLVLAAIVVAVVAILFLGKLFGLFNDSKPSFADGFSVTADDDRVTVPNIVGKSVAEAEALLSEAGLKAHATTQESQEYDANIIISQNYQPNTKVEKGTQLEIVISSGKVLGITVPDLVGKSEAEAKVALSNEGFEMVKETIADTTVPKGTVVKQDPLGATTAKEGSIVTVYISTGTEGAVEGEKITVPELVGQDEATAKKMLTDLGLVYNTVSEESSDTVAAGIVISQTVDSGAEVNKGSVVDFKVSSGPAIHSYSCSVSVAAPANYLLGSDAIIVLTNAQGGELGRFSTQGFPFTVSQNGIIGSPAGFITVTYMNNEGGSQTTDPVPVTFTQEI